MNTFLDLFQKITGHKYHYEFVREHMEELHRIIFSDELEKGQHIYKFHSYKYKIRWEEIKNKKIRVYGLFGMHAIGECIPRFFDALDDKEEEGVFRLFIPCFPKTYKGNFYNGFIFELFEKEISIVNRENFEFWNCVFKRHGKNIDYSQFYKYILRRPGNHLVTFGQPLLTFSDDELIKGKKRMSQMGLTRDFVCIHARGRYLKKVAYGNTDVIDESDYRACDINTFSKACNYIYKKGIDVVRMGKFEKTPCDIKNIIDYSNKYWNGLMDFYLLFKCKYILGSESGLSLIAPFWGRPVLVTNFTEFACTNEALPSTGMDMYIPKKQWSVKEKRYLNLYEMFEMSNRSMGYLSNYVKEGIVFEDNTEDEILEAVKEFEAKLEGRWVEEEEEKELMERYYQIVENWVSSHKWTYLKRKERSKTYTPVFYTPSYIYLKNNKYLLSM